MQHFYFFRHAESVGNVHRHLIGGQSNHFPLTDQGIRQAHLLGERLKREQLQLDEVYSSPAVRARHTAEIVCEHLGLPPEGILLREELLEMAQGRWEGQLRSRIFHPERAAEMARNPLDFQGPEGESQRQVEERMLRLLQEIIRREEDASPSTTRTFGLFTHGMALKCLLRRVLGMDARMTRRVVIHNASMTRLRQEGGRWWLTSTNDFAHLAHSPIIGHY